MEEFVGTPFDLVITVCDNANETCPVFPGSVKRLHWPFEDPADVLGSREVREAAFRRIRDQLYTRIAAFLKSDEGVK